MLASALLLLFLTGTGIRVRRRRMSRHSATTKDHAGPGRRRRHVRRGARTSIPRRAARRRWASRCSTGGPDRCRPRPTGATILDRYEVTYPGLEKPIVLFLDAYHFDDALKAPKGFTCAVPIGLNAPPPDPMLAPMSAFELAIEQGAAKDVRADLARCRRQRDARRHLRSLPAARAGARGRPPRPASRSTPSSRRGN